MNWETMLVGLSGNAFQCRLASINQGLGAWIYI